MTAEATSLETVAALLAGALRPLVHALGAEDNIKGYVSELGWDLPTAGAAAFSGLSTAHGTVIDAYLALEEQRALVAEGTADDDSILVKFGELLVGVLAFSVELKRLPDALRAQLPPDYLAETGIADTVVTRLLEDTVVRAIADASALTAALLDLLGFIEEEPVDADPAHHQPEYTARRIRLDRVPQFFQDPAAVYADIYGWGTPQLDVDRLFRALQRLSFALLHPAEIRYPSTSLTAAVSPGATISVVDGPDPMLMLPLVSIGGLSLELGVFAAPKANPTENQGLALTLAGEATFTGTIPIASNLALGVDATLDITTGVALVLRPDTPPAVVVGIGGTPVISVAGHVLVRLIYARADGERTRLISIPGGSRLELAEAHIGVGVSEAGGVFDPMVEAALSGGRLVISTSEADGFLSRILPAEGITLNFDFGVAWSQAGGLRFQGGASLEATFSLGLVLGPFRIDSVSVALGVGAQGIDLGLGVTGGGVLGPVSASVDRIGLAAHLDFHEGNLGPVDLGFKFKPPRGLGIAIDAGPVSGGGFIEFDPDNGRYAGVLQLSIYAIQVTAIGLLDTRLPGGASGFSFLIIISVEFTPIQLGFGFTLNGVGGLAGINRTFVVEALQAGVRAGTLDHILFPHDAVRNAPQIISDLRTIFPPAQDRYVFGPMVIIGYGTPTLVEAKLGIILEVPSPVVLAILGQINVAIPTKQAAVVDLHLDVLGVIDFGKKLFSLDASLHDSRIAIFTISGDMALRLSWGDNPSFALSIGGFNPHFTPPPSFPDLHRLTIGLNYGDVVRITIQGYFAITSNTFQFGVRAEAFLGCGSFNVYGWLGFDALFVFSPFSFIVDFTAGLALRSGTTVILGISLEATFSGPTPWHVEGTAYVTILFFDIGVHVEKTWGEEQANELPSANAWTPLEAALHDPRSWSPALPSADSRVVTLSQPEEGDAPLLMDPSGGATLRQKILPLGVKLEKFGEAVPEGQDLFTIDAVTLDGHAVTYAAVNDSFARGQFQKLSDAEKLSLPSFEPMQAGVAIGDDVVAIGRQLGTQVEFETIYIDSAHGRRVGPLYALPRPLQLAFSRGAPAASAAMSKQGLSKFRTDAKAIVSLAEEQWVVAGVDDMSLAEHVTKATTKGAAHEALKRHLEAHPQDRGRLQVVATHEIEGAA